MALIDGLPSFEQHKAFALETPNKDGTVN